MRFIDQKAINAQKNIAILEELIKEYEKFILSCASETSGHFVDKSDDEWSIALLAFYAAVQTYDFDRGSFLAYAKMLIRSRLIDYFRSQNRHGNRSSATSALVRSELRWKVKYTDDAIFT